MIARASSAHSTDPISRPFTFQPRFLCNNTRSL